MKFNCVIVEDEPLAAERARIYAEKLGLEVLEAFDNGIDALAYLKTNPVDILFLDINLGELSGIRLLETSNITAQVILTTAYHEYALQGYELNVTDYLLKPFTLERFIQAVDKAKERLIKTEAPAEKKFIFVKTEYRLEKILFDEILFVEGMRDYRRIHTTSKRIMTLQTFKELEQELPNDKICRVHKSYMVAIDKIESIEKDEIKIGEKLIPVSETYKKDFLDRIR